MNRRSAFTMIELLVVITIMMILMGMLSVAVTRARQRARILQAESGARELVDAWRAYNTVYGGWPWDVSQDPDNPTIREANLENLGPLLGDNPRGLVFLEFDAGLVEGLDAFYDPWGNVYHMRFGRRSLESKQWAHVTVTFPNRDRYKE